MKRKVSLEKLDEEGLASLYIFTFEGEDVSEYAKFFRKFESRKDLEWEFDVIDQRITKILENGAEDEHFRLEGKAVKALPIDTGSKLRLYCYRIDKGIIIIGNGGEKPRNPDPNKNKTKDFPELYSYCETIRTIGQQVENKIKTKEISRKGNELLNLKPFEIEIP